MLLRTFDDMLGRRIFYMSISQSIRINMHKTRQIQSLCKKCMRIENILVQLKHFLSFELISLEQLLFDELKLENVLIKTQR